MVKGVLLFLLVTVALIALLLFSQRRHQPEVVSGFIEAHDVRVGSRVGGRVLRVLAQEGQAVAAGELLIELEPFDLQHVRAQAVAERAAREADWRRLEAGFRSQEIAQAEAVRDRWQAQVEELRNGPRPQEKSAAEGRLEQARAQLELAQLELERWQRLAAQDVASRDALDRAVSSEREARAAVDVRQQEVALLREGTRVEEVRRAEAELAGAAAAWELRVEGSRPEDIAAAKAALDAASATLAAIDARLAELRIVAPVAGIIEAVDLQPGDLVNANTPVLSLILPEPLWVRTYVPQNRVGIQVGDEFTIRVDALPETLLTGRVSYVAREAEFTPGNVQTPEERADQVFRARIDLQGDLTRVRPGMAASVTLEPRRE